MEHELDKELRKKMLTEYPPGSNAAVKAGCECAIMDNGHGNGYMGQPGIFAINSRCPLHGADGSRDRKEGE